jgi:ATP-dependent DNA helicase RecG
LTEAGMVEAHGSGRGRTYTLSARVYRKVGQKTGYIHQAGFDPIQQEQMVLSFIDKHGSIKRADVMELCRVSKDQAYKLLYRLKKNEQVMQRGELKKAVYERKR